MSLSNIKESTSESSLAEQIDVVQIQENETSSVPQELVELLDKTVLAGLTYYDINHDVLQQRQLSGVVVRVTPEDGITLRFPDEKTEFTLPSDLSCWFKAPSGRYYDSESDIHVQNPHFLVTWDIYKSQDLKKPQGEHEWWEWRPNVTPPSVG